ncbi:FAD-binding oxidoreductase [Polaromonas sp. JS666]|uniref:NAD(P)/FAD-dependent oxidoreductase n=1 Tax=Polaromonas sp. (strain JS666 / ATCC BAA-500) TaxID=296591 RepID=UPI00088B8C46|nr:FAD-dependent oxidoreductase [Polaromonas sp. JS666]SDM90960.1 Glycine/D-amino acid oxidase [Polaromonas sp. JS666]
MREFDILIVGAGIAGASLAWRLAGQRSVALLERESQPGYHSTGRSAAMFMETYGPPMVRALTRASRAFYELPPEGFAPDLMQPRGVLYLATHGQEQELANTRKELLANCPGLQTLDARTTLAHVPCLRPDLVHGALYDAGAQDMDVHALHQGFLRGFRQKAGADGELRNSAGVTRAAHDGRCWTVELSDGQALRARTVVNAAGAWADELAAVFGVRPVGLVPHRRSAFTFKGPEGVDASHWPAVVDVDESYYFKPDAGQLLGSPANADPTVPHDVVPEELDIAMGIHQIESVTTLTIRRPASTWAGLRSFVPDGEMVIGHDDTSPGFFWLAAQGGYGIQSAAGASALADALLREAALPEELLQQGLDARALSPARLR